MWFFHNFNESFLVTQQVGVDVDVLLFSRLDDLFENSILAGIVDSGAFVDCPKIEDSLTNQEFLCE